MDVKSVLYMTGYLRKHSGKTPKDKYFFFRNTHTNEPFKSRYMYGVNRVSLDSMLTLRSCHLFLISALFKQYSLVHETHLNGVRLADQPNEFGTQVCLWASLGPLTVDFI